MTLNLRNIPELGVLVMLAAATSALLVFIKVTEEVVEGDTGDFDESLLMLMRSAADPSDPLGPVWLEDCARDITAMGSPIVLGLAVASTACYFLLAKRRKLWLFMLSATLSGSMAATLLKQLFDRPRPETSLHGMYVYSSSFPSGHAMLSALVYLTLGALIARLAPTSALKVYVMMIAILWSGLVGISRIYLGVHWPSDVLAGWAAGAE